jgi:hypothetical protein
MFILKIYDILKIAGMIAKQSWDVFSSLKWDNNR